MPFHSETIDEWGLLVFFVIFVVVVIMALVVAMIAGAGIFLVITSWAIRV